MKGANTSAGVLAHESRDRSTAAKGESERTREPERRCAYIRHHPSPGIVAVSDQATRSRPTYSQNGDDMVNDQRAAPPPDLLTGWRGRLCRVHTTRPIRNAACPRDRRGRLAAPQPSPAAPVSFLPHRLALVPAHLVRPVTADLVPAYAKRRHWPAPHADPPRTSVLLPDRLARAVGGDPLRPRQEPVRGQWAPTRPDGVLPR